MERYLAYAVIGWFKTWSYAYGTWPYLAAAAAKPPPRPHPVAKPANETNKSGVIVVIRKTP